jgi:hypothetical protein
MYQSEHNWGGDNLLSTTSHHSDFKRLVPLSSGKKGVSTARRYILRCYGALVKIIGPCDAASCKAPMSNGLEEGLLPDAPEPER